MTERHATDTDTDSALGAAQERWLASSASQALTRRAQRVFNLPLAIFTMVRWCAVGGLATGALAWWGFQTLSTALLIPLVLYSVLAGVLIGSFWGAIRVVAAALDSLWQLIELIFDGTDDAFKELARLRRKELSPAAARSLANTLYHRLIYPVVQRTVRQAAGLFARPITWALDRSVDRLLQRALRTQAPRDTQAPEPTGPELLARARANALTLRRYLRRIAIFPLALLATLNTLLVSAPLILLLLLLG
ncbi:hypothetical protein DL240_10895 [Lujinxingia litoralis]|uniref:Uncharacterized protein n=1 Tax=Lujinxingia litoralis TaxID=2211119 RepID=A0A328C722_9DELT|nr:hypothetical protein [Lujinxingia litoralis]RAL22348.1 hypothetical protein DL240_10895 [Lujinxingia litoralis]